MSDTDTITRPDVDTESIVVKETKGSRYIGEPGDHERFAHYASKKAIESAIFNGTPCKALCGKVWVPNRDPQRFPVCLECKEIWESLPPPPG